MPHHALCRRLGPIVALASLVACTETSNPGTADGGPSGSGQPGTGGGATSGTTAGTTSGTTPGADGSTPGPIGTTTPPATGSASTYGEVHNGTYDLGPVEFHGSFPNSCSPYTPAIEAAEGVYLAGVDSKYNGDGRLCDACVLVKTAKGKSLVLRIVTTGQASTPERWDPLESTCRHASLSIL